MKIALIGYGRMGKEMEALASERHIPVTAVFTRENNPGGKGLTADALKGADVCIDFSTPDSVVGNIEAVAKTRAAMVVGTTGWQDHLGEVRDLVARERIGFLYAGNFSIGVLLMEQLVSEAARLFGPYQDYDVSVHETHHRGKVDSPSGTALSLASAILRAMDRKRGIVSGNPSGKLDAGMLHVSSSRVGSVPGIHEVRFSSPFDSLELIHTAGGRRGFANGALMAAEWLCGRQGFFTMNDILKR